MLGPNGAGKSTLLRALAGLTPLTAGRSASAAGARRRRHAAPSSSRPRVRSGSSSRTTGCSRTCRSWTTSRSGRALGRAGPHGRPGRGAQAGSTGWVWPSSPPAARPSCPAARPSGSRWPGRWPASRALLLLDEPLSALDARTRLDVQAELRRHLSDFAGPCLLVTHDPLEALVLADRLVVIEDGRIVQDGTPARGGPATGDRVRREAGRAEPLPGTRATAPRWRSTAAAASWCPTTAARRGAGGGAAVGGAWSSTATTGRARAPATRGRARSPA